MIGWVRNVFAARAADPALPRLQRLHAARAEKATETAERAIAVADRVVREGRDESMRSSFDRAGRRLTGE